VFSEPRVTRDVAGRFRLHLPEAERAVVRQLPAQLRAELQEPEDPDLRRVFPPASQDDDDLNADYRSLVGGELVAGRRRAADVMEATADAEELDEDQILAWLSTVNDLRLILGTRLGVTDDYQDEDLPDADPRAQAFALYHFLGFLEEQIVEVLSEALSGE
jgi:Domain of unknown function (DUF2017)